MLGGGGFVLGGVILEGVFVLEWGFEGVIRASRENRGNLQPTDHINLSCKRHFRTISHFTPT